jgi:DNA-nicking Smr family endonuclease
MSEPIPIPIDGVLDLHSFRPQDVKEVVNAYLEACLEKKIYEVRIVHGKGIGQIHQTVHSLLEKHPDIAGFSLAGEAYGGSEATFVRLQPGANRVG